MPIIIVHKPFRFAVDGNHLVTVQAGEQDVSERCALVAVEHLKAARLPEESKPEPKARSRK